VVDFWPDPHFECDTRSDYLVSMGIIILVLHIILGLVEFYCVVKSFMLKASSVWEGRGRMYLHWGLGSLGSLVYACGLISGGVVGTNVACSLGFAVMWAEMFCGWTAFNSHVISFLKKSSSIFTPGGREAFTKGVAPFQLYMPYFEVLALPIPALVVLVYNLAPDAAGKALIALNTYVSVFMAIDAYVCAVTCASFCTNIKTIIDLGVEDDNEKSVTSTSTSTYTNTNSNSNSIRSQRDGNLAQLKTLNFHVKIVELFAMAFGLLATPLFIVFAASPYLRHKVMWTHLICISCAAFPQLLVVVIFMPRGAKAANTPTGSRLKSSTASESVVYSSAATKTNIKVHVDNATSSATSEDALEAGPVAANADA